MKDIITLVVRWFLLMVLLLFLFTFIGSCHDVYPQVDSVPQGHYDLHQTEYMA